jgi:hypothetical protein
MTPDLTDEETVALVRLLSETINDDRYPLSPRLPSLAWLSLMGLIGFGSVWALLAALPRSIFRP